MFSMEDLVDDVPSPQGGRAAVTGYAAAVKVPRGEKLEVCAGEHARWRSHRPIAVAVDLPYTAQKLKTPSNVSLAGKMKVDDVY